MCKRLLKVLWDEGFISGYNEVIKRKELKIFLKYKEKKPVIRSLKMISKPGWRVFYSASQINTIDVAKNFIIFSTNWGIKSINYCKKYKIGGKPLVKIN